MGRSMGVVGAALLVALAVIFLGPGEGAEAQEDGGARAGDAAVGASIALPEGWTVERERYTSDGTYGFTLWKPESGDSHDHGGEPAVRVALAPRLEPGQIEGRVRDRISEYPDLPLGREQVLVGEGRRKGVAVGPIPGSTPSTEVYVPVDGRVYQVNVYGEGAAPERRVRSPSRSVASLRLPDGESSAAFARGGDEELVQQERAARESAPPPDGARSASEDTRVPRYEEGRIAEGCWTAASSFFFQTQHGKYANRRTGDGIRMGWTIIGRPNFWGQYTHGSLGYGRCDEPNFTNDKFAIDYPLNGGDVVFSPFKNGTVTFAGRNHTHQDYGIFVTIRSDNGKYVSMSAHLSGLAGGIKRGAKVTEDTIIGFAGNTGGPNVPVGEVHVHQAFYRKPSYGPDGAPYGGAGLQAVYHHYVGTAARKAGYTVSSGVYRFGAVSPDYRANCHERTICGEGYAISN